MVNLAGSYRRRICSTLGHFCSSVVEFIEGRLADGICAMTLKIEEIERIVADCSAEILGREISFEFYVDVGSPDIMRFVLSTKTTDIKSKKIEPIYSARAVAPGMLRDKRDVLELLLDLFKSFMVHEAEETFNCGGVQFRNPHAL